MPVDFNVYVTDGATKAPITEAVVSVNGRHIPAQYSTRYSAGDGGCNFYHGPPLPDYPHSISVFAAGYKPYTTADQPVFFGANTVAHVVELVPFKRPSHRPALVARAPLGPFPDSGSFVRTLPWDPPQTRDYLRANAWGITLPGIPWVGGASDRHPERLLSWFLDRYDRGVQQRWLDQNAMNGYTHVILSAADSMAPIDSGPNAPPGAAQSINQLIDTCGFIKQTVPYVTMFLGSKYFQPAHMNVQQWLDFAFPIMEPLIRAKVVDEFIPGWEWNLWNTPGPITIEVFKSIGQFAHDSGCSCWMHFSSEYTSWYADGEPRQRFGFYDDIYPDIDGIMYQGVSNWDVEMVQARIVDTLWQFGTGGNRFKFRFFEDVASLMFDHDRPNEDDADLRGYLACCTIDNVRHSDAKVWGYGNGGRLPDGNAL